MVKLTCFFDIYCTLFCSSFNVSHFPGPHDITSRCFAAPLGHISDIFLGHRSIYLNAWLLGTILGNGLRLRSSHSARTKFVIHFCVCCGIQKPYVTLERDCCIGSQAAIATRSNSKERAFP